MTTWLQIITRYLLLFGYMIIKLYNTRQICATPTLLFISIVNLTGYWYPVFILNLKTGIVWYYVMLSMFNHFVSVCLWASILSGNEGMVGIDLSYFCGCSIIIALPLLFNRLTEAFCKYLLKRLYGFSSSFKFYS